MTTIHDFSSDQASLMDALNLLARKGTIRQIDYQFARFIYAQVKHEPSEQQPVGQALAFIAGVVSSELGKGHICLSLYDLQGQPNDFASKLGLFGESALALNTHLQRIDWIEVLRSSPLVGEQGEALPLMFDGERLYLHRYWHYEVTLAEKLHQLGAAVSLAPQEFARLSELLNHLFARQYHFLFNALIKATEIGNNNQVQRQQLVCDHLDVVESDRLDWPAIDSVLRQASKVQDLQSLDELVPLLACVNWQKVAAAVALTRRFAVISGGPGTGKTTTVTKLLAALIEQATQEKNLTIKLVAPTGKAAARLTESIGRAVQELPVSPELKAKIPTESSTLHRLLGAIPNSAEFRHNKHNPLHLDILVIDEASMVDLPMMYKVVDALPKHARLILLGDKDQLASVEAGAVLGDICSFHAFGYSKEQAAAVAKLTGFDTLTHSSNSLVTSSIADSLCMLQKSYRFDARSGIGQLAKAVNSGSAVSVDNVWAREFADIEHFALSSQNYNHMVQTLVKEYGHYLQRIGQQNIDPNTGEPESVTHKAKAVLDTFNQCRLLCAIREGDFGVAGLNQRIEKALAARKLIQVQDEVWYHGRPVMVTRNDHGLGLYNGDIGICMRDDSEENPRLKVFFELPDGSVKSVLPSRVPEHETAYAMTIHKSQGSEFDYTLMILPPDFSPILTRELIYTGITRAKKRLALYAELNVLKRGIRVKTTRASGLVDRLTN
ncbi:exodeoxyribonuclease V subunit alpha [Vibrio mytili]|uniref:exodeoxyribonuclease V subunit alpha n=1 Tax=Vibrio mytili TaxID=50718 RepID=UPI003C6FEC03